MDFHGYDRTWFVIESKPVFMVSGLQLLWQSLVSVLRQNAGVLGFDRGRFVWYLWEVDEKLRYE